MFGIWFLALDTMLWGSSILWYISVLNFFLWLNKIPLKWIAHIYLSIHQLMWNWSLSTSAVMHNAEKHILHEQTLCFRSISVSRETVKLCGNYTFSSSMFFFLTAGDWTQYLIHLDNHCSADLHSRLCLALGGASSFICLSLDFEMFVLRRSIVI